jgi:GxxExxY protein
MRRPEGLFEEKRTRSIIGAFYELYNILGCGFRESVYAGALERELRLRGHEVAREVWVRVYYKGEPVAWQRVDMLVDGVVAIEIKSTSTQTALGAQQLFNYLKATQLEVGLLFQFTARPKFYRLFAPNERFLRGDQSNQPFPPNRGPD